MGDSDTVIVIRRKGFVSASYVHHRGTAVACNIMGSVGYSDKFGEGIVTGQIGRAHV